MSFIFQAIPKRYDLRARMKVGIKVSWVASRYRDEMSIGDIVYFWLAGDPAHRGFYGWGVISELPEYYEDRGYRVEVEYRRVFLEHSPPKYISAAEIRQDPVLKNHLIFRMSIGTNFLLTDEEDQALRVIIARELGQNWLPPQPPAS